jgi:hypothetical protein
VVHVASSRRSQGNEAKDGRFDGIGCGAIEVGSNYSSLDVIFLLAHRGILVFVFTINRTIVLLWEVISLPPPIFHGVEGCLGGFHTL